MNGLTDGEEGVDREECNRLKENADDGVAAGELNAVADEGGYERHEMLTDSGSSSSFLKRGVLAHLGMEPASSDEAQRSWSKASGGTVRMRGTTQVNFDTNEYMPKSVKLKRSEEVDKTIGSVSEFADKGNTIIFTKTGGAIIHDPGEKLAKQLVQQAAKHTPFRRNRGTYTLDMWVKKAFDDRAKGGAKGSGGGNRELGDVRSCGEKTKDDQRGDRYPGVSVVPAEAWREFSRQFDGSGFTRLHP